MQRQGLGGGERYVLEGHLEEGVALLHGGVLQDSAKNGSSDYQEVKQCLPCHACSSDAAAAEGM